MVSLSSASYAAAQVTKRKKRVWGFGASLRLDRIAIILGCAAFWAILYLIFK